jgi:NADPH-dependent 2,4-dienoyl-CoA reductase/sulfur reductase-like enzyme
MPSYQANLSRDGNTYTKKHGLVRGLTTYAVIKPERKIRQVDEGRTWEAIVVGSGYAGLVAARDLVKAGESQMRPAEEEL